MVQIVTFAQEWMSDNVTPPVESSSLAVEMNKRAIDQEKVRSLHLTTFGLHILISRC